MYILKMNGCSLACSRASRLNVSPVCSQYLFVSLRNREACYKLLRSVCPQLKDGSANSSPLFSSAENSFDQDKLVVSDNLQIHKDVIL